MAKPNEIQVPDFRKMAIEAFKGLPEQVGEKARAFFLMSFIKEGFTDSSFIAWPKGKGQNTNKLLSQSLALRGSIKVSQADMKQVVVSAGEGLPYAAIHNEGGTINVKVTDKMKKYFWFMYKKTGDTKYKFMALTTKKTLNIRIAKRQFIGESDTLNKQLDALFVARIIEAQKRFTF
jgi:phage gpG-like protein